ncbi:NACHT domain-containing protein [Streptomyces sp. NBC_00203]|uniref:NACHT domain-containing protein n=1 Tax=Streptomyces sp. NBC_00203 TaxID=2975680 RepID=UPI003253961D
MLLDRSVVGNLATVCGLFVGIASLLLALLDFFRQEPPRPDPAALADDLALRLREQWLEEAQARQLRDPRVLPLTWTTTSRDVVDTPGAGAANARVLRIRLDGRLDGRFDEVISRLAAGYAQVPNRRLVAIGEPGSGKTVLAILLTLGLLGVREPGGPAPVLLPVSSWDPVRERLDDWIVRTLAQPYYNGRAEIPRALLAHGLLLPVLDALDEIPESARRSAIRGINQAIGGERPIVVTCRATEYEDLIRGGAPTLRRAAVVEVSPLPPEDVVGYLREVDWPADVDWEPVFARLRAEPDSPVAAALSTPLMVTSARLVYQRGGGQPGELLDRDRFDCTYAVEDHLTHGLVDAAYAPDPHLTEEEAARDPWTAEQARRWLTFLACYLHDRRERDLAWWLMSGRLLSPWAGPVTGLGLGVVLVLAAVVWMSATQSIQPDDRSTAIVVTLCVGGAFALFNSLVWYTSGARPPGRLTWSLRGSTVRLLSGFRSGALLALVSVVPLLLGFTAKRVIDTPGGRGMPRATELYVEAVTTSAALAVVVGLALAARNWLDAPPLRATQVSPVNSLAQDRRSSLLSAAVAGLVVGLLGLLGWYAGVVSGDLLLRVLTHWSGWPARNAAGELAADRWDELSGTFGNWGSEVGIAMLLPGTFVALLVLMGRAWPRFLVARVYLAARGRLPWRLMAFLADARRRELLRQSGGVYQFRHIRLQETLAGEPTYADEQQVRAAARRAVRRRVVLAAGVGVALAGSAKAISGRRDESVEVLAEPKRRAVLRVAMEPGRGRELAYLVGDRSVWRWSGHTDQPPEVVREALPENSVGGYALAFPTDGSLLVMGSQGGAEIRDPHRARSTGSKLVQDSLSGDFSFDIVAFHRARHYLACGESSWTGVWKKSPEGTYTFFTTVDLDDVLDNVGRGSRQVTALDFFTNGSLALMDDRGGIWRSPAPGFGKPEALPLKSDLWKVSDDFLFNHDYGAGLAVSRSDDSLALFGPKGGELWRRRPGGWGTRPFQLGAARTGVFHPTGRLLAVADFYGGDVQLWHTGGTSDPYKGRKLTGHDDSVLAMDFSQDGRRLATAGADGTVRLWKIDDLS